MALTSHDSQLANLPLTTSPLTLQAQVNLYAALAFLQQGGQGSLTGGGASYLLDFGNVLQNTPEQAVLAFLNNNPLINPKGISKTGSMQGQIVLAPEGPMDFANLFVREPKK